jgi:hypothetical protein
MYKFLYALDLLKLSTEDVKHLKDLYQEMRLNQIENLPRKRSQDPMDSLPNFARPLKKN